MAGKVGKIPWSNESKIICCKDCIPPKRHIGCHDTCEEYKKEKAEYEIKKQKERAERRKLGSPMGKHEFDMLISKPKPRRK